MNLREDVQFCSLEEDLQATLEYIDAVQIFLRDLQKRTMDPWAQGKIQELRFLSEDWNPSCDSSQTHCPFLCTFLNFRKEA